MERDPGQDADGVVWKAKHLIGKQWEEDGLETFNPKDPSRKPPLGSSKSVSEANIDREVTAKFRHADQLVSKHIKPPKRRRGYFSQEDRTTETDTCMSDAGDDQPLPAIKSLFDSTVSTRDRRGRKVSNSMPMASPECDHSQQVSTDRRKVYVHCPDGPLVFIVSPSTKASKIMQAVARSMSVPEGSFRLILSLSYARLDCEQTVYQMGLKEYGDIGGLEAEPIDLEVIMEQYGGKPVIYLYPPQHMLVDVTLSLCPQCRHGCLSYTQADSYRVDLGCSSAYSYPPARNYQDSQCLGTSKVDRGHPDRRDDA